MTIEIRLEGPADRAASVEIERAAFSSDTEAGIVEAVRDEDGSFALVAEEDGEVVGHVQFSRAWVGDAPVLGLGPIGVVPDRQGAGIGSALMRAGLEEARARGEVAVILFGEPAFYSRFGSNPASRSGCRTRTRGRSCPTGRSSPRRTSCWHPSMTGHARCPERSAGTPLWPFPVEAPVRAL